MWRFIQAPLSSHTCTAVIKFCRSIIWSRLHPASSFVPRLHDALNLCANKAYLCPGKSQQADECVIVLVCFWTQTQNTAAFFPLWDLRARRAAGPSSLLLASLLLLTALLRIQIYPDACLISTKDEGYQRLTQQRKQVC